MKERQYPGQYHHPTCELVETTDEDNSNDQRIEL
jgi:hypothetical protein